MDYSNADYCCAILPRQSCRCVEAFEISGLACALTWRTQSCIGRCHTKCYEHRLPSAGVRRLPFKCS